MKIRLLLSILSLIIYCSVLSAQNSIIEIPEIFSDNMILQQNSSAPFWGKAVPNSKVTIKGSWGKAVTGTVGADSLFQLSLKTPSAGGPFKVQIVIGKSKLSYKNVLVGEVWLCSGQSNMEMPLKGWMPNNPIEHSTEAIASAKNPNIRFFTVTRSVSDSPKFNCVGKWTESTSETAAEFSATAYFFGIKLYNELKIPIGLINSSWGGTPIEAWISSHYLSEMTEYKPILDNISVSSAAVKEREKWLSKFPILELKSVENKWEGLNFQDEECSQSNFDDSKWKSMVLPVGWENTEVKSFDGVIWFRKKIKIPVSWIGKELVLELGPIDDMDVTFVNGQKVGTNEKDGLWQLDRVYPIQKEFVTDSIVTVAVRVIDNQGGGGIYGLKSKMNLSLGDKSEKISVAGNWKYLAVAEYINGKFSVFGAKDEKYYTRPSVLADLSPNTPTMLYNGMISPIKNYSIKGALWYQGETNTNKPDNYSNLLSLMIRNWRSDWKSGDFPFYFVQISPYEYGEVVESQKLREAQMKTLSVKNTGMVVTLDIGNPADIHPANKKDVGERLAFWALAKEYGKKVQFSGPIFKSMKTDKNKIILSFDYSGKELIVKERNGENNILIAGKDKIFRKAQVQIKGGNLIVSNSEINEPVAVRYCWSNTEEGTLFNNDGLPASSFRTDNW